MDNTTILCMLIMLVCIGLYCVKISNENDTNNELLDIAHKENYNLKRQNLELKIEGKRLKEENVELKHWAAEAIKKECKKSLNEDL